MIQGKRKIDLTPETILQKITPYDLFHYYMGSQKWELNEATISPFPHKGKLEENPSFIIGNRNGYLHFVDFSLPDMRGDVFTFIKLLHGLSSMNDVLLMIDKDFGLGISSDINVGKYKRITAEYKQPEIELGKRYSVIQCITRKFTKEELQYWEKYEISEKELREEHIYSIKGLYLNRQKYSISSDEIRFGYLYDNTYWKAYFPYREKRRKWLSNVPLTILDGKEAIQNCDIAFITKSKKDKMILKKFYPFVTSTQNESVACFSPENVEYIKTNSKRQVLLYDSDDPGVIASQQITSLFGFEYCNPPRKYLPEVKDFSDMAMKYSLKEVETFIKNKLLL